MWSHPRKGKRKGHQLLASSQLRSASATLLSDGRKIDVPVQKRHPMSVEDVVISIPSPWQARPFPPLGCPVDRLPAAGPCMPASCSEGMCCVSSCIQSEPSAVSSPPQPLETLAPAAKNRASMWPMPNEREPEAGAQSLSAGAGLKTDERTEEKVLIVVNF